MISNAVLAVMLVLSGLTLPPLGRSASSQANCFETPDAEGMTVFGPMREKALDWDRFLLGPLIREIAGEQLEAYRRVEGIPLEFMLAQEGSGALQSGGWQRLRQSGAAGSLQPHPCGRSVQAFVKDLAGHGLSEWLLPDWVLEYNRKGKVVAPLGCPPERPGSGGTGEFGLGELGSPAALFRPKPGPQGLSRDRDGWKSQDSRPPRTHLGGTQDRMPQESRHPAFRVSDLRVRARPQDRQDPQIGLPVTLRLKSIRSDTAFRPALGGAARASAMPARLSVRCHV